MSCDIFHNYVRAADRMVKSSRTCAYYAPTASRTAASRSLGTSETTSQRIRIRRSADDSEFATRGLRAVRTLAASSSHNSKQSRADAEPEPSRSRVCSVCFDFKCNNSTKSFERLERRE